MKIHTLIHAPFEKPGVFKSWAQARGYEFDETHVYRGETVPSIEDADFFLFMGGPQGTYETEEYPYLRDEIALAANAMDQGKYVVGVCLGAQIMGEAKGQPVEKSPEKEVGFYPVQLTAAGKADPLFEGFSEAFLSGHWHGEMPGLPEGAQVLAESTGCPRQIIRYAPKAIGFQCHMEMTPEMAQGMVENCPQDLEPVGPHIQPAEELLNQDFESVNQRLIMVLDRLVA